MPADEPSKEFGLAEGFGADLDAKPADERVYRVVLQLYEPAGVSEIAERGDISSSWPTSASSNASRSRRSRSPATSRTSSGGSETGSKTSLGTSFTRRWPNSRSASRRFECASTRTRRPTTAETIADAFDDVGDLRDTVTDLPDGYAPVRLSSLDRFGPSRARTVATRIDESGVLEEDNDA